ncbi:interferon regulatory factor 5 [Erpetoichthys calabaricus]|uniref:Interferon regulatory factor 5 n=1 Tax=Erpetoichthys calabaricus TaxID=27687 RepID=A0A8C4SPN8_ERPCA|nr:interferon regulatory factor 5 [Erpetoichthys calabaricus]XP_028670507.1 interferon regulatory factor 5 [Erpetoichthys calabaricus]XP_028670514.1 interferon regulatory factor 5 [Erpetoichthys calabaricus]XP_028670527.1 interferon regulatory factor 5 [Erpetoichthys calabaricus]XP_028670534.1 interferon regulatory factor 5 [Erpetoichthys calabaricus]XP_051786290.1 interferon regulatory factor 5 [Erpetoichthys calabaricus]XP_051786293.1 interferon regulatory factor 5 [Erpetoichthys calabaricu
MSIQPRRIRLKPWLIAQVNSGNYPGLQWISHEQKLFQIPWRHATRHIPTPEDDNTVFKAWALETGKYKEGFDEPDPAKWKANFRCALNKSREFKLKYDGTKKTPVEPFKIYEVCDQHSNEDQLEDEDADDMILDLRELNIDSTVPSYLENKQERLYLNSISQPEQLNPAASNLGAIEDGSFETLSTVPISMQYSEMIPADFVHGEFEPNNAIQGAINHQVVHGAIDHGVIPAIPAPEGQPQMCINDLLIRPHMLPLTDLDIKFQYRGRQAGSLTVSNPQGCRLYYGNLEPTPDQVDLFGPVTLQQVLFPDPAEIPNQKQMYYTNQLLDVMDRGLILEIHGQDIYAIRLCQCKVYWSGPGVFEQSGPNPIEREKKIKIFSLNSFLQELILYQKGETNAPPPFEIYFCFGEVWPDRKPKEKKLIIVQVVPVVARILTEMFSGELSWSTDSIRLQISNPDLKDQTVEQFKELHRLWQHHQPQGQWGMQPATMH